MTRWEAAITPLPHQHMALLVLIHPCLRRLVCKFLLAY